MISPPPSLTFTLSRCVSGNLKLQTDNENPAKRSFAQHNEDQPSQLELKRRDPQHSRRAPLNPLSVSELENRRTSQSADAASHHSLFLSGLAVSDVPVLHPVQPVSSGSCGMQRSGISDALVCSWPPPIATPGTTRPSHNSLATQQAWRCGPLYRSDEKNSSRATSLESISTCVPPDAFLREPTATMVQPTRWKSEIRPIRPRTNSMPSVRRPPEELWRSGSGLTKVDHEPVDAARSSAYPPPPGLPPLRPDLRRSGSSWDLHHQGSVTLSLALGSLPLRASEPTKAVPPIGAERNCAASNASLKSHIQIGPAAQTHGYPLCFSPRPEAQRKNEACLSSSPAKVQTIAGGASTPKEDFKRLLRHALGNKHAPKVVSPLNPLRAATLPGLSSDPAYRQRMPSQWNNPSPRYSVCPLRRARTICDGHQSLEWDSTCMHCQECKRDTIGKKLLAFRFCQQRARHTQRNKLHVFPFRCGNASDRRATVAYEMDDEERNLWAEIAAVTGEGPLPFSRGGAARAAATHRRGMDNGNDDGAYDDYPEIADEAFCANESGTLFREVSVY